jgi:hypothetical protein
MKQKTSELMLASTNVTYIYNIYITSLEHLSVSFLSPGSKKLPGKALRLDCSPFLPGENSTKTRKPDIPRCCVGCSRGKSGGTADA